MRPTNTLTDISNNLAELCIARKFIKTSSLSDVRTQAEQALWPSGPNWPAAKPEINKAVVNPLRSKFDALAQQEREQRQLAAKAKEDAATFKANAPKGIKANILAGLRGAVPDSWGQLALTGAGAAGGAYMGGRRAARSAVPGAADINSALMPSEGRAAFMQNVSRGGKGTGIDESMINRILDIKSKPVQRAIFAEDLPKSRLSQLSLYGGTPVSGAGRRELMGVRDALGPEKLRRARLEIERQAVGRKSVGQKGRGATKLEKSMRTQQAVGAGIGTLISRIPGAIKGLHRQRTGGQAAYDARKQHKVLLNKAKSIAKERAKIYKKIQESSV